MWDVSGCPEVDSKIREATGMVENDTSGARMARLGKWLAGGIGVVTAATTAVGIGSGDLERVLRNEAPRALLYLMLVAIGIGSGVVVWQTADSSGSEDDAPRAKGVALAGIAIGATLMGLALFWPSRVAMSPTRWLAIAFAGILLVVALVELIRGRNGQGSNEEGSKAPGGNLSNRFLATAMILIALGVLLIALYTTSMRAGVVIVGLLVAAIALAWVGWPLEFTTSSILVSIGFMAFFVGLSGFFALAVDNTSAKDRPTINASLSVGDTGGLTLQVGVVASGLRTDEHVLLTVEGLNSEIPLSDVRAGRGESVYRVTSFGDSAQPLHLSRTGPDKEGAVDLNTVVAVSPGLYERIRINAFLVSAGSNDVLGQLEQLDRRVAQDRADRVEYDESVGASAIPEDLQRARGLLDEQYRSGDLDQDQYDRLLKERAARSSELYDERVGVEELEARNKLDQETQAERSRLLEVLETEIVQDVRCSVGAQARGCVIILIPESPVLPLISATARKGDDGWMADVGVDMAAMSAEDVVVLEVSTRRSVDEAFVQIYAARLPANRIGALVASMSLPLAPDVVEVCVKGEASRVGQKSTILAGSPRTCDPTLDGVTVVDFSIPNEGTDRSVTEGVTAPTTGP